MLEFILLIVFGWKSFLWSRVERMIFEFGKVCLAFSTTALRESDTRSCWLLRSLVPVWMMMWLGWPSWDSVRSSRALLVLGHQCLTALCRGKSCFMSMYFPFESMSRAILVLLCWLVLGCCQMGAAGVVGALDTRLCDGCELSGSGLSESGLRGGCWLPVLCDFGVEGSVSLRSGSALVLVWSGVALSPALSGPGSHCAAVLSPVSLSAAASLVWDALCPVAGVSVWPALSDSCLSLSVDCWLTVWGLTVCVMCLSFAGVRCGAPAWVRFLWAAPSPVLWSSPAVQV